MEIQSSADAPTGKRTRLAAVNGRRSIGLLAALLLVGCSYSTPRYRAVYSPMPAVEASGSAAAAGDTTPGSSVVDSPAAPGASSAASVDTSAWIALAPEGTSIRVLMPSQPTSSTQVMKTPVGNASSTSWASADPTGRVFYTSDVKFPLGALADVPAKSVLDSATGAVVATVSGAKLSSQSDISLGGHTGRTISYGTAEVAVRCDLYVVGDDVYGVCARQPTGKADDGLSQAFFESFRFTV